jgi:hypothetical protein
MKFSAAREKFLAVVEMLGNQVIAGSFPAVQRRRERFQVSSLQNLARAPLDG